MRGDHKARDRTPAQEARKGQSMSALAVGDAGGGGPPGGGRLADPTVAVDGDVVLSGVVLIFVALAFVFVMHHFLTAMRRRGPAAAASGGRRRGGRGVSGSGNGVVGVDAEKAGGQGGVDPALLRALPVAVYRAEEFAAPPLECAVCIAEVADGEAARFLPGCGHGFHAECVDLWLGSHSTCPLCRVAVDDGRSRNAASATRTATAPPFALSPVQPEPANYAAATSLPTNVLFWGTHGAVRTTTARTIHVDGRHTGPCPSSGGEAATVLVMEVPATTTTTTTATATTALRDGGAAAKPQGSSARLVGSLRRMWS